MTKPVLILLAFLALSAACGDGGTGPEIPAVAFVTLAPDTLGLAAGDSARLAASVVGEGGRPLAAAPVVWSSSDTAVAGVSATGVVRALAPGGATVTATAGGKSAHARVQVYLSGTFRLVSANGRLLPAEIPHDTTCTVDGQSAPVTVRVLEGAVTFEGAGFKGLLHYERWCGDRRISGAISTPFGAYRVHGPTVQFYDDTGTHPSPNLRDATWDPDAVRLAWFVARTEHFTLTFRR